MCSLVLLIYAVGEWYVICVVVVIMLVVVCVCVWVYRLLVCVRDAVRPMALYMQCSDVFDVGGI